MQVEREKNKQTNKKQSENVWILYLTRGVLDKLEGTLYCHEGDWDVKLKKGNFY